MWSKVFLLVVLVIGLSGMSCEQDSATAKVVIDEHTREAVASGGRIRLFVDLSIQNGEPVVIRVFLGVKKAGVAKWYHVGDLAPSEDGSGGKSSHILDATEAIRYLVAAEPTDGSTTLTIVCSTLRNADARHTRIEIVKARLVIMAWIFSTGVVT